MRIENDIFDVLNNIERSIAPKLSPESSELKDRKGEYKYIPLPFENFYEQINVVSGFFCNGQSKSSARFVDVGCGIGTKLIAARVLLPSFFKIDGIENCPEYVNVAQKLVAYEAPGCGGAKKCFSILEQDALMTDYSPYDVVYFYCPFEKPIKQRVLEQRIISTAKSGAYIMANLKQSSEDVWHKSPMRHIWRNKIFQKE